MKFNTSTQRMKSIYTIIYNLPMHVYMCTHTHTHTHTMFNKTVLTIRRKIY